jgi:tetraacyldisaccharide 4'-kinase
VVTKCEGNLADTERDLIIKEIGPLPHQKIFFSCISYGIPYHITREEFRYVDDQTEVLLVTGIANPRPLKSYLEERIQSYYMMHYNDHHIFSIDDWKDIRKKFEAIEAPRKVILTTEKDAMRLMKFRPELDGMPFYVVPIEHSILFGQEDAFMQEVTTFIENFKQPVNHGKEKRKEAGA